MIMVAEDKSVHPQSGAPAHFVQSGHKPVPIRIIPEDRLASIKMPKFTE